MPTAAASSTVNALLEGDKWGAAAGSECVLTYSSPWTSPKTANFSDLYGTRSYSFLNEQNAAFGQTVSPQLAAKRALASWADVANIRIQEVSEASTNVGDIRFAWTSVSGSGSDDDTWWGWSYVPDFYYPRAGDVWINSRSSAYSDPD